MPFRIPCNYQSYPVYNRDPNAEELREYLDWLCAELAVATVALEQLESQEEMEAEA